MSHRDISHYRIVGPLGQGAMGEVYRAVDQRLGREVALKMLPAEVAEDPDWQTRQLREAQAASALNHPGIVTLYDIASADGRSFLVMELVSGDKLSDLARSGLPWRRAVELAAGVAEALAAAHGQGILHRDIKSDNVMVTAAGQVKVLDFGLAKLRADAARAAAGAALPLVAQVIALPPPEGLAETVVPPSNPAASPSWARGQALSSDLTHAGQLVGTPAYMAPECFDGGGDVRSEVFSLGVLLHELLAGVRPFDRGNAMATMGAIRLDDPEPPSQAAPGRGIPARVDRIVARALAKAPADRFPDMPAFAAALRAVIRPRSRVLLPWAVAAVAVAGGVVAWRMAARPAGGGPTIEVTASRRLTMEGGCEEYPRFAPAGDAIIYDGVVGGDYEILTAGLDGAGRRRLTRVPGWDYGASISPDGQSIAYLHEDPTGRTLRVVGRDGDQAAPARDLGPVLSYPTWSADGALLMGDNAGRIVRLDLEPGRVRETVLAQLPEGGRAYHLAALAGGRIAILWWTSADADATALGELEPGGELRVLEQSLTDYEGGLAAGPGGGYYFTRRGATTGNQLLYRAWGGGEPVVVPGGLSPRAGVDVSADGRRLVFSTCTEKRYIARLRPGQSPVVISRGEWQDSSPFPIDRTRLLLSSDRVGRHQAWVLDLDTGEARPVTPPDSYGASPSVDGRQVVFAVGGGLAVQAIAGGAPRRLTSDPSDALPVFSHDGAQVIFERAVPGAEARVHAIPAGGGPVRALVAAGSAQPAASPIDATVAFVSSADGAGRRRVLLTDLSGAPPREVPGLPPAAWQRPRFSTDGKRLLLLRGYQEVVEVALDGAAPPQVMWRSSTEGVHSADYAPDGDGVVAALAEYDGDLWLAEGVFP